MKAIHLLRRNTRSGSRRNIAAHYDLGNEFFRLFLSEDLMYSSAYWTGADDTLEAASTRKLNLICRKLALGPDDHVVEIGTGWGGFAVHAAKHYGVDVVAEFGQAFQAYALLGDRFADGALGAGQRMTAARFRIAFEQRLGLGIEKNELQFELVGAQRRQ